MKLEVWIISLRPSSRSSIKCFEGTAWKQADVMTHLNEIVLVWIDTAAIAIDSVLPWVSIDRMEVRKD